MSLNIIIPSYNRYDFLDRQLKTLRSQVNHLVSVTVLNNKSTDLRYYKLKEEYPFIRLINNVFNLGIVGNILRSYEYADKGYLWILSDDDIVEKNAVDFILKATGECPDHIYLKAQVKGERKIGSELGKHSYTRKKIIKNFSSISMLGLISANVYKVDFIKNFVDKGYLAGETLFPHVAIFFSAISRREKVEITILDNCIKWNYSPNTYPEIYHMAYLNHFKLDTFLHEDEKRMFRISYISEWGITHIAPIASREHKLIACLKQSKTLMELFLLLISFFLCKILDFYRGSIRGFKKMLDM